MNLKKITLFLLFLLLFFGGTYRLLVHRVESLDTVASYLIRPVLVFQNYIVLPIEKTYQNWISYARLKNKYEQMIQETKKLQADIVRLQAVENVIEESKELREFAKRYYPTGKLAQVIMKEFDAHHTYTIDIGSTHGVEIDMVAVVDNALVGRVSKVYPLWRQITLITDPECKVAVYTSKSNAQGIHEGILQKNITCMRYVSHLKPVKVGELVFSTGEGLIFPKGFALGTIIKANISEFNYDIEVEPMLDFNTLSYCYIIKKGAYAAPDSTE